MLGRSRQTPEAAGTEPKEALRDAYSPDHQAGRRPGQVPFCATQERVRSAVCWDCIAYERGQNCWELPLTPCCDRDRSECQTCEVYISYVKSVTQPVEIRVRLRDGASVTGRIFVPRNMRVSRWLSSTEKDFVTVADAKIRWPWGEQEEVPVVFVAKTEIGLLISSEAAQADSSPAGDGGGPQQSVSGSDGG